MQLPTLSREAFTDNWVTIVTVFTLLFIVLVIVYVVYRINMNNLQSVTLSSGILKLASDYQIKENGYIPNTVNGQEFSYSFWVFVTEVRRSDAAKLLWYRSTGGAGTNAQQEANPVVYMHPTTNKLTIMLKTNMTTLGEPDYTRTRPSDSSTVYTRLSLADQKNEKILKPTIEYLPLQRWVHVVFVVQDDSVSIYMDGNVYSVDVVTKLQDASGNERPVFKGTAGSVVMGVDESFSSAAIAPINGYLSKAEFFNYALMPDHVKRLYAKGPIERTWLSMVGLSGYKFQNPLTQA